MFNVIVSEKGSSAFSLSFNQNEVNIGRVQENDVVLPKHNISKYHSRIVLKDGKFIVLDLHSTNGTYVNGRRIAAPQVVKPSDKIFIGDYTIAIEQVDLARSGAEASEQESYQSNYAEQEAGQEVGQEEMPEDGASPMLSAAQNTADSLPPARVMQPAKTNAPMPRQRTSPEPGEYSAPNQAHATSKPSRPAFAKREIASPSTPSSSAVEASIEVQRTLYDRLMDYFDSRRAEIDKLSEEEVWSQADRVAHELLERMFSNGEIQAEIDRDQLVSEVLGETLGLGPIEAFLADDDVSQVMVNNASQIYVEKKGKTELTDRVFSSNEALLGVIERMVIGTGARIDESAPLIEARLGDGTHLSAIVQPFSLKGPCLILRRPRKEVLSLEALVAAETLTQNMADFLQHCVGARKSILISGNAGVGKTTTLNAIANLVPAHERIVTVEEVAELQLTQENWIQLEAQAPNHEAKGRVALRDLLRSGVRLRPDRIILGECRSGETCDLLQATCSGHDGLLTSIQASSPQDAIARMEMMAAMTGADLPSKVLRSIIASSVNIVVHQARFVDGSRLVTHITEILGLDGNGVAMQDIFVFKYDGLDENGQVRGRFAPTGVVPAFCGDLAQHGIAIDTAIFHE